MFEIFWPNAASKMLVNFTSESLSEVRGNVLRFLDLRMAQQVSGTKFTKLLNHDPVVEATQCDHSTPN